MLLIVCRHPFEGSTWNVDVFFLFFFLKVMTVLFVSLESQIKKTDFPLEIPPSLKQTAPSPQRMRKSETKSSRLGVWIPRAPFVDVLFWRCMDGWTTASRVKRFFIPMKSDGKREEVLVLLYHGGKFDRTCRKMVGKYSCSILLPLFCKYI